MIDPKAAISESLGRSEEDTTGSPANTVEPAARRQWRMDWQEKSRFLSKQQWQASSANGDQFVVHTTRHSTKGVVKQLCCIYRWKPGWHNCLYRLRVEFLANGEVVEYWNREEHDHKQILPLRAAPLKDAQVQDAIKEGVLDGLKPEQIIMKLEQLGLPVPSRKSLYNKIAYIRRTLTQYSSEFSTKDLKGWAETLSGSTGEDEAFVISSTIDDSAGEDGIPNF